MKHQKISNMFLSFLQSYIITYSCGHCFTYVSGCDKWRINGSQLSLLHRCWWESPCRLIQTPNVEVPTFEDKVIAKAWCRWLAGILERFPNIRLLSFLGREKVYIFSDLEVLLLSYNINFFCSHSKDILNIRHLRICYFSALQQRSIILVACGSRTMAGLARELGNAEVDFSEFAFEKPASTVPVEVFRKSKIVARPVPSASDVPSVLLTFYGQYSWTVLKRCRRWDQKFSTLPLHLSYCARFMTGIARHFTSGVAFMIFKRMECMVGENGGVRLVFGELSLVLANSTCADAKLGPNSLAWSSEGIVFGLLSNLFPGAKPFGVFGRRSLGSLHCCANSSFHCFTPHISQKYRASDTVSLLVQVHKCMREMSWHCEENPAKTKTHYIVNIVTCNPPRNFHYKMLGVGVSIKLFFIEVKCSCFEGLTFYRELWFDMVWYFIVIQLCSA